MYVIPKDYNNTEGKKGGGVYMYVIPKDYNNTEGKKGGGGIYVCYTKRLQQY